MEESEFLSSISDIDPGIQDYRDDNSRTYPGGDSGGVNIISHISQAVVIVRFLADSAQVAEDLQIIDFSPEFSDLHKATAPDIALKSNVDLMQTIGRISPGTGNGGPEYISTTLFDKLVKVKVTKLNNNGYVLLHFEQTANNLKNKYNIDLDYAILNNIDGCIVINQDGKIMRFNTIAEKMFGYTRFEIQGNNVSLLMTAPHADKHDEYLKKYNTTGRSKILQTVREVQARRKNGEIFPMELMVNEIYLSNQKYFVGIVRDLSNVKKYDSFDMTINKYLRHTVFNKIPTGLIIVRQIDEEHQILLANEQFLKMFNFQNEHIVNKSIILAFPSLYNHEQAYTTMLKSLKTGEMQVLKSIKIMNINVSMMTFFIDSSTCGIFFYSPCETPADSQTPIVERSRRENAILLSNIGHEIRISVNTILGNIDLLRSSDHLTADQEKYIEDTNECTNELLNTINDILVYTQIETDEFTITPKSFRFQQLIIDSLDIIRNRAAEKNIQLPVSISKRVPDFVIGDYDKIKRVVQNILLNAVKYTEVGKIVTRVDVMRLRNKIIRRTGILDKLTPRRNSIQQDPVYKYMLVISITDTGIGIPKSMHENIFKPFVRVKEKNQMYGTGLGLYICKWYAEKLGGSIRIDSDLGVGSTFHIEIPINEDKNIARITKHTKSANDFAGKNILIVEPDMADRNKVSKLLMQWNLSIFMCEDLDEMKVYLKNQTLNFSIVLMNTTLAPCVKDEHRKFLEKIPVIGLSPSLTDSTSGSGSGEDDPGQESGLDFEYTLSKPIDQARLYSVCVKLLIDRKTEITDDVKKKLRILIIDDNSQNTVLIAGQLQQMGYTTIDKMTSGLEIIKKLKKSSPELKYDVILMDFYLPKFTGDLLTQAIKKKIKDEHKRPMIVGMTASTSAETKKKAFAAGVDAFLLKPLNRKELSALLLLIMKTKGIN